MTGRNGRLGKKANSIEIKGKRSSERKQTVKDGGVAALGWRMDWPLTGGAFPTCDGYCYGLNVCDLPKFTCWYFNP